MDETETKYEVPGGTGLPPLSGLPQVARVAGPDREELAAEYFDTDDLRLLAAGVTLRRREGGHDAGWHLKLPVGAGTRREIQLPLGGDGAGVPGELAGLVQAYARGEPLRPVARIATRRERWVLLGEGGESLAEIADDDVTAETMGEAVTVSHWHEVEVELTGGDPGLLAAADELLRRDGLSPAGRSAKLERALGYQRPRARQERDLTPASPAGDVVMAYVAAQAATLTALDPMVRRDEHDAVHQMRVATRRLRSTMQNFRQILPREATAQLNAELKWIAGLLGEARDAEVTEDHVRAELAATPAELLIGPVEARVQAHFAHQRAAAHTELLAALDSARYFSLLGELERLLAHPPLAPAAAEPAAAVLPAAGRRAFRRTRRRMDHAWQQPAGGERDLALHEARKAAKRARYAGEALAPAFGQPAERFAKQMKKMTSLLGEHQDAVVARQLARELGIKAHLAGENAFTYGLLHERAAQAGQRAQAKARKAWRKAARRRYRRWLS